jgi:glyoxylase-like metal-dependent hydrolase (beta-lactamase superfamily II)
MKKILFFNIAVLLASIVCAETPSQTWSIGNLNVTCLFLGDNVANCYVISTENRGAYVVDPGGNASEIIAYLKEKKLNVTGYLITHGHNDHIKGLPQMHKSMPASAGICALDLPLYIKRMGTPGPFDYFFQDGATYGTDDLQFTVIYTPGHSPGGVCFYFKKAGVLFSGDTLFKNGKGRTDLDGGSDIALQTSLKNLGKLPPQTVIFPGHGGKTVRCDELNN